MTSCAIPSASCPVPAESSNHRSYRACVVGPVEKRLALSAPATQVARHAMLADLRDVAPNRLPATYLAQVVRTAPPRIIAAIPLEPPARIFLVDPALCPPHGKRLRRIHAEAILVRIVPLRAQL